ncbi:MAG: GNAT family N-acetyltransferase [Rhodospirillales bacterium]|nr:GNAT family N-acetyltransferase [Rhodospirillales bacterium]
MSSYNLGFLFDPKSVAVIGASVRPNSVGNVVMRNLLEGGFEGPIMPVNPKYKAISGVLAYADVAALPLTPELAVLCVPPQMIAQTVEQLCAIGTRAAIVLTAGLGAAEAAGGGTVKDSMLEIADRYGMRLLGPNCLGLLVPKIGLNASFAHRPALPGKIAFVSQSGALCTAVLDWARPRGIGFSHFISMGDMVDVDFGDVLDYLASDPATTAILLYIESIRENRKFMSAARAAARNKTVLAIKAGRHQEGAKAAASHTGALAGSDVVFDAAFRRAGMLRVFDFEELFAAVETLSRRHRQTGERLAVLTNGGGLGVLAVDNLMDLGGKLAELSAETIARLDAVLPSTWSGANPVDIIGDAPGQRYTDALRILFEADEVDSVLCMHCPVAVVGATTVAEAIIEVAKSFPQAPLMTCFVGEEAVAPARAMVSKANIATFDTPLKAVQAFMHTVHYRRNQELLMELPPSLPSQFKPDLEAARLIVGNTLASGHTMMNEPDAKAVLAAYGMPTVETHIVTSPAAARDKARAMGFPVALKIISPAISHKSDVGGVVLDLQTAEAVEKAAVDMLARVRSLLGDPEITGFSVQTMARRPGAYELIIGVANDSVFGPVILFGEGGTAVEVIGDSAVALPPLNMALARDMVSRTRVYKRLQGYRDRPAADIEAICLALIQVAQLIIDLPEIEELDINPLFADANGILALDARIKVGQATAQGSSRLAIRPYPAELESSFTMTDGRDVLIRPIRPEDEPNHHVFISKLTPEDIRFRFFGMVRNLHHSQLARLTQIDYDREMAFIAIAPDRDGLEETLGVVRIVATPDNSTAEFSIVVRSDLKGTGLGKELMRKMIGYCNTRQTRRLVGQVMNENQRMIRFVKTLGFRQTGHPEKGIVEVTLDLKPDPSDAPAG